MAIKGLTDQQAAFPQIGILRKGAEKKPNAPGEDLTYFRFTSEDDSALAAFRAAYSEEPRDINVYLPYPSMDENFGSFQEHWVAGGLKHRCDGETCLVWQHSDGSYMTTPKPCPGKCKAVGRLAVVIPELKRLAFVTVLTTSLHDIMTLSQNLRALELMRGDLRGIPLVLRRRPRKVSTPREKGPRVRQEKWLLTLEAAPEWVELQLAAQHAAALPQIAPGEMPDLVAPDDENSVIVDHETGEILDTGNGPEHDGSPPGWFDDAPPEEVAPETRQEPDKPANGNGRPLNAEHIQKGMRTKAGWVDGGRLDSEPVSEKQTGAVAGLLEDALASMPKGSKASARHDILEYLYGVRTTGKLTDREASAIISWLKVDGEEWDVNEWAIAETARCLEAFSLEKAQQELPM